MPVLEADYFTVSPCDKEVKIKEYPPLISIMFFDKIIYGASRTNLLQTFIIQSPESTGPERERPSFLLYPGKDINVLTPS